MEWNVRKFLHDAHQIHFDMHKLLTVNNKYVRRLSRVQCILFLSVYSHLELFIFMNCNFDHYCYLLVFFVFMYCHSVYIMALRFSSKRLFISFVYMHIQCFIPSIICVQWNFDDFTAKRLLRSFSLCSSCSFFLSLSHLQLFISILCCVYVPIIFIFSLQNRLLAIFVLLVCIALIMISFLHEPCGCISISL